MKNNKYADSKVVWFPEKLASFRDGTITAPIYVRIKPSNRCPHFCNFCAYGHGEWDVASGMHEGMDKREMLPRSKLLEVLWDMHEMGVKATTFSGGGEPLSYPYIVEAMRVCLNYRIDLSCITNGALLEKDRAEVLRDAHWLRVSLDYTNKHQMAESRKIPEEQFARIIGNMRDFARLKRKCELGVNYIVTHDNYQDLAGFCALLKDIGVDNIRISPVWRPDFTAYHAPIAATVRFEIDKAQRLNDERFTVYSSYDLGANAHSTERLSHRCWFTQMVPVIGADQIVYHCHNVAYSDHGVIGSIKNQRFKELWFSAEAKAAFERLDPVVSCRHQCAAAHKNEIIESMLASAGDSFV